MQINPYLNFNGQCEEAFHFYERCLGGKIDFMMTYEASPMASRAPPDWGKKIIHSTLRIGDQLIQGADSPGPQYQKPQGFSVAITLEAAKDAERIFAELAAGGSVQVPLAETFWAARFGILVDRFGTPWIINCDGQRK